MTREPIVPILLAAGESKRLPFPKALASFGAKTAIEIALENCAGLPGCIVVLGAEAQRIRARLPAGATVVIHRRWRAGQLSSLLAGLRHVARGAAFLVYPVDHPLLTRRLLWRLVAAFDHRAPEKKIFLPRFGRRAGHPTIFSPETRAEIETARTAREVVYRDRKRIAYVAARSSAIWEDFDSPATYARCLQKFLRRN